MQTTIFRCAICLIAIWSTITGRLDAKDSANVPAEVVQGWRNLAANSETFCAMVGQADINGNNKYTPGVLSRLNNRYAKLEVLHADANKDNWRQRIKEVLLYDGDEYFTLERPGDGTAFSLSAVGNNRALYRTLNIDTAPSTSAFYCDLLQVVDSTTETFTKFERRSGQDEGVYVTLTTSDLKIAPPSEIVAKLDPEHDYRVVSAIQTLSTIANYRNRTELRYSQHPALASETLIWGEIQERGAGTWKSANPGYPYTTRHDLLDMQLVPKQFTLEHYGLPAFRKRNQSIRPIIASFVGGLVLVCGTTYWWRRRQQV